MMHIRLKYFLVLIILMNMIACSSEVIEAPTPPDQAVNELKLLLAAKDWALIRGFPKAMSKLRQSTETMTVEEKLEYEQSILTGWLNGFDLLAQYHEPDFVTGDFERNILLGQASSPRLVQRGNKHPEKRAVDIKVRKEKAKFQNGIRTAQELWLIYFSASIEVTNQADYDTLINAIRNRVRASETQDKLLELIEAMNERRKKTS